ncbi:MAG: hypothetical protein AB7E79_02020 [Rhodospirillaceae bacterium]
MRKLLLVLVASMTWAAAAHAAEKPKAVEHPGQVALVEEDGGYIYRTFPNQLRMYVYDKDKPPKFGCSEGCINAWPPVWAPGDAKPTGEWTLIDRPERNRKQWAYKGRPVYTRFHDTPTEATGAGMDNGAWKLLVP